MIKIVDPFCAKTIVC